MKWIILLAALFFIVSCDEKWGQKALDFANNKAPTFITEISKKDLEYKWNTYFVTEIHYGIAEVNLANNIISSLKEEDLRDIESNPKHLFEVGKELDLEIETLFDAYREFFKARDTLNKISNPCQNDDLLRSYLDNSIFLTSSINTMIPNMGLGNLNFSIVVTGDWVTTAVNNAVNWTTSLFAADEAKENKDKAEQAKNLILNFKLDEKVFQNYSHQYCQENAQFYQPTIDILKTNLDNLKNNLDLIYNNFVAVRNALAPFIIQNMLKDSPGYQEVKGVERDFDFVEKINEIYFYARKIKSFSKKHLSKEDYIYIEQNIAYINDYLNNMYTYQNTFAGGSNQELINTVIKFLNFQKDRLIFLADGKLK